MQIRKTLGAFRPRHRRLVRHLRERQAVSEQVAALCGHRVQRGPFAGMVLPTVLPDGSAKILGSYEEELHPTIQQLLACKYRTIVNIGCSDGYYAVGLGRLVPGADIYAFDTSAQYQGIARETATANGTALTVAGECTRDVLLELCSREPALVICDCEGCEGALVHPNVTGTAALIVELHPWIDPTAADIPERYANRRPTELMSRRRDPDAYPEIASLDEHQRALAVFERGELPPVWPQRWLVVP